MQHLRTILSAVILTTMQVLSGPDQATALSTTGDGNVFDETTGLTWGQPIDLVSLGIDDQRAALEDSGRLATVDEAVSMLRSITEIDDMLTYFEPTFVNLYGETWFDGFQYWRREFYAWEGRVEPENPVHLYSLIVQANGSRTLTTTQPSGTPGRVWELQYSELRPAIATYRDYFGQQHYQNSPSALIGAWALVPEPTTAALFGLGLAGLAMRRGRARSA